MRPTAPLPGFTDPAIVEALERRVGALEHVVRALAPAHWRAYVEAAQAVAVEPTLAQRITLDGCNVASIDAAEPSAPAPEPPAEREDGAKVHEGMLEPLEKRVGAVENGLARLGLAVRCRHGVAPITACMQCRLDWLDAQADAEQGGQQATGLAACEVCGFDHPWRTCDGAPVEPSAPAPEPVCGELFRTGGMTFQCSRAPHGDDLHSGPRAPNDKQSAAELAWHTVTAAEFVATPPSRAAEPLLAPGPVRDAAESAAKEIAAWPAWKRGHSPPAEPRAVEQETGLYAGDEPLETTDSKPHHALATPEPPASPAEPVPTTPAQWKSMARSVAGWQSGNDELVERIADALRDAHAFSRRAAYDAGHAAAQAEAEALREQVDQLKAQQHALGEAYQSVCAGLRRKYGDCDREHAGRQAAERERDEAHADVARLREHVANVANRRGDLTSRLAAVLDEWERDTMRAARDALRAQLADGGEGET
jgi:hypothetical protein